VVCKTNVETHRTTSKKDVVNKISRIGLYETMLSKNGKKYNTTNGVFRLKGIHFKTKLPDIQAK